MAATPKKLVHWALDLAKSPSVGSPGSEDSSTDSCSSSLPYINSQLIAHGYTHQPGISLDGTSKEDAERVVKCLLSMLSQRIVSRETLSCGACAVNTVKLGRYFQNGGFVH